MRTRLSRYVVSPATWPTSVTVSGSVYRFRLVGTTETKCILVDIQEVRLPLSQTHTPGFTNTTCS